MIKKCLKCGNEFDVELMICLICGYLLIDIIVDKEEVEMILINIDFEI